jgi:HD superfamily phosphodiesterase
MMVQDADRLDIGAIGIAEHSIILKIERYDPKNSSNTSMTKEEYKRMMLNNKSFLRKAAVKDKMNTETGKKIAQRHQYGRF